MPGFPWKKFRRSAEVNSNSDWMSQLPPKLHTVPLYDLAIPGSHDSITYDLDVNSSIVEPQKLRRFSKICCVRKIVHRWASTQDATVTEQLDAGVRYLDLRIARKPNDPDPTRLYFYHGLYTRTDVETVLREILEWAKRHPKEILNLAFSNFRGFEKQSEQMLHNHLIKSIKTLFGDRLVPRWSKNKHTLKSCWDIDKNIIVSYDYKANQDLWMKITYFYGNSMKPADIESRLCRALEKERPYQYFFVCGLNLTLPNDARILKYILRLCDNFHNVILRSLPKMVQWLKKQSGQKMNIVASDMVTRDDFVTTVIELNSINGKA
ncbi:PI-PLC X domain-containing protein 1-like isoform X1 [Mugil cephalus]|uniref:PI-PLC X domain-containing protein 1-like isoform X1 n=1 Tax=Mugil cephalus TaxID=48193 RepID=UPI001FB6929B|nr:PI-PLC X domain-containing protein 1-like isoform X1 [Mugil cephalus]